MKFEKKIFIFILITLVAALSIINFISIYSNKSFMQYNLNKNIARYLYNIHSGADIKIPYYLKFKHNNIYIKNYYLYDKHGDYYIYLKNSYFKDKLSDFALLLFLWEAILMIVVMLGYYVIIYRASHYKNAYNRSFDIVLGVFEHKTRNFLTSQNLIIENGIEGNCIKALNKLSLINSTFEHEIERIDRFIELFKAEKIKIRKINLRSTILKNSKELNIKKIQTNFKLFDYIIKTCDFDYDYLIYIILSNAFKYSDTFVNIKMRRYKKHLFVTIKNDISQSNENGLGVGLQIAELLSKKNKIKMRWSAAKNFTLTLKLPQFFYTTRLL